MSQTYFYSIKDLSKEQALSLAYYFYILTEKVENYAYISEAQKLYKALINKLELTDYSKSIIQSVIKQHIAAKALTKKEDDEDKKNPYQIRNNLSVNYNEDDSIEDNISSSWCSKSEDDINLIRAIFAGSPEVFHKIVYYTFFRKYNPKIKCFDISKETRLSQKTIDTCSKTTFVKYITDSCNLNNLEGRILNLIYLSYAVREFSDFFNTVESNTYETKYSILARCLNADEKEIRLSLNQKLDDYKLINTNGHLYNGVKESIYYSDLRFLFSDILKSDNNSKYYKLNSFCIESKEINLVTRLLSSDSSVNLLLYGESGTGKTEFARSLINKLGYKTMILKNEKLYYKSEDYQELLDKFTSVLTINISNTVIIVDEAEDILMTQNYFYENNTLEPPQGIINKMLEHSNNKVIWIMNHADRLKESTKNHFTYSIKFKGINSDMLKYITDSKLNQLHISSKLHTRIADLCEKYHVSGASVDNIVRTVDGMSKNQLTENEIVNNVQNVFESNSVLLQENKKMRDRTRTSYNLSVLNTTVPAEEIINMVINSQKYSEENYVKDTGIRMLFYGLSGTGKTELARYIAEKLNKKLILKRPSDILGKYVGENEENIRKAFDEAESSGDILLYDEADTFFADRSIMSQSWERSTVNEFLTEMEEFSGILICTTNLRQIIDPALQRRFHILTEFKPLCRDGIKTLLGSYFKTYNFEESAIDLLSNYNTVTPGDFGVLAGKLRFMSSSSITSKRIIDELCSIQEEKESCNHRIGFTG